MRQITTLIALVLIFGTLAGIAVGICVIAVHAGAPWWIFAPFAALSLAILGLIAVTIWKQHARGPRTAAGELGLKFADPLARATSWQPAAPGGAHFATHRVFKANGGARLLFGPSTPVRISYRGLALIAASFAALLALHFGAWKFGLTLPSWLGTLMPHPIKALMLSITHALAAAAFYFTARSPHVFDRPSGMYWKGTRKPVHPGPGSCALTDIRAVQVLPELVKRKQHTGSGVDLPEQWNYELNLVLRDAHRIHLTEYPDVEAARDAAQHVATFVTCKVWDGSDPEGRSPRQHGSSDEGPGAVAVGLLNLAACALVITLFLARPLYNVGALLTLQGPEWLKTDQFSATRQKQAGAPAASPH